MGKIQYILIGVLAVGLILVGVAYAYPELFEKIPIIGNTVQAVYYANVDYEVAGVAVITDNPWVNIKNVTVEKKIILLSIGPLGLWPGEQKGVVVVESIHKGVVVDRFQREVDVSTGWVQFTPTVRRTTDTVKLGPEGSGQYTIKVSFYNRDGYLRVWDSTIRTI